MLTKYCEVICCSLQDQEIADPEQLKLQQQRLDAVGCGRDQRIPYSQDRIDSSVLECSPAQGERCPDVVKMNHGP